MTTIRLITLMQKYRVQLNVWGSLYELDDREMGELAAAIEKAEKAVEPLVSLLRESKYLLRHEAGCMAGWAEVGVVYADKRCSCHVGACNTRIDALLS